MDGRWTIWKRGDARSREEWVQGPVTEAPVPVVPCDDAAIERAVKHLWLSGWEKDTARQIAKHVLRAAGETP